MKKRKLVVVGNGMAGMKCVEHIVELAPDAFDIAVVGSEPHPNYNRILLSKVLQGDTSINDITINDWDWYKEHNIHLFAGETVKYIDKERKRIETLSGLKLDYDSLILATGSSPFLPQLPGIDKEGVTGFRNMEDCRTMIRASSKYKRAAVIGGGLLGLEAARGLLNLGMEVDVVHNAPYLMNRQLDVLASDLLKEELLKQGMRFWLEKRTEKIIGRKRAEGLLFSDGTKLKADLIVVAVGISPNIAIAAASGIGINRAIVVNDYMETDCPNIYAIGECAEHRDTVYGLVAPLYEQGKVLAQHLCGMKTEPYAGSVPYAQLKVSGVEVFSAGAIWDNQSRTAIQHYDGVKGTYKKVLMRNGKIIGAVLYGDSTEGTQLLGYIKKKAAVSVLERSSGTQGNGDGAASAVDALADSDTVCACNGVCKSVIVEAVLEGGAKNVIDVRDRTKATGSCGGCKPLVAAIIEKAIAGGMSAAPPAVAICGCTDLDHVALKSVISKKQYKNMETVRHELNWRTTEGCRLCGPALIYYVQLQAAASGYISERSNKLLTLSTVIVGPSGQQEASGVRDNKRMGASIESKTKDLTMPHSVTIAVSAGTAYPAGVLVSDFGIMGSPIGWELYTGGHSEHPVKQAQLISVEASELQAQAIMMSCIEWYRQSAFYGEPAWKWLERVGLHNIREIVLDAEVRNELLARQRVAQGNELSGVCSTRTVS